MPDILTAKPWSSSLSTNSYKKVNFNFKSKINANVQRSNVQRNSKNSNFQSANFKNVNIQPRENCKSLNFLKKEDEYKYVLHESNKSNCETKSKSGNNNYNKFDSRQQIGQKIYSNGEYSMNNLAYLHVNQGNRENLENLKHQNFKSNINLNPDDTTQYQDNQSQGVQERNFKNGADVNRKSRNNEKEFVTTAMGWLTW